jgi:hypothetical protein
MLDAGTKERNRLRSRLDAELRAGARHEDAYGGVGEPELIGDEFVGLPDGRAGQHLPLAVAEGARRVFASEEKVPPAAVIELGDELPPPR